MTRPSPPFAGLLVTVVFTASCGLADVEVGPPDVRPLAQTTKVYDAQGRLITELHGVEDRVLIGYRRIPQVMKDAVVAIEDQRYWHHRGIDLKALLRAAYSNLASGEIVQGGSTITEQFVKNRIVGPERSLGRKIREAAVAWRLEDRLSKEQILARYLNTVYFGRGAYGIQRAAHTYFSRPATELRLHQAALLAGLIAAPSRWDPFERRAPARERRDFVLSRMRDLGMISRDAHAHAVSKPLGLDPPRERNRYPAPWFIEYVKREILHDPRFGETYDERYRLLFEGGLRIHTTLDLDMQEAAERAVRGILYRSSDPYAGLTAVDPRTGEIKAMVGGRDYFASPNVDPYSKVNLATGGTTGRQPGSAFKPFALVAALEAGIPPTATYPAPSFIAIDDARCRNRGEPWTVSNYSDARYSGSMTLEQATIGSVNSVYAQIVEQIGPERVAEVARRMGIRSPLDPVCSLSLGSNEVNTLEMASAYGTLATNGRHTPTTGIARIEDARGGVIYRWHPRLRQVVPRTAAWVATQILRKVVLQGTGRAANIGRPQAGKTGTNQLWRDAWFVGYIPQFSAAVWVGHPSGQVSMASSRIGPVVGGSWPAQIWHAFMAAVTKRMPVRDFHRPAEAEFVTVPIDVSRGCVATEATPQEDVRYIQFVPGTEPSEPCDEAPVASFAVVPSVVGLAASEAYATLQSAGFTVSQSTRTETSFPAGSVVSQSPDGGVEASSGSVVTLVVAA
ncbi:MAG TPA: penicillin-binding protein [Actinomycetota bacterium]|nr:penicillin-binding protein [Actinomycetota bacterium]